jgi:epoxyqueuosine reductase
MMLSGKEIKSFAHSLGADRCGIAGVDRYTDAPAGFHPSDIYPICKSVVVFLKHMPAEVIQSGNAVVYTHNASFLYNDLDRIGTALCYKLEKHGMKSVPVPTDVPYMHWEPERLHGMGILSMRHSACKAGLGILGRNTLLINPDLGNLVYIGAILCESELEPDPLVDDLHCPTSCRLCLDACPVNALDGTTVNQEKCRKYSNFAHPRGWDLYTCSECRSVCPYMMGKSIA